MASNTIVLLCVLALALSIILAFKFKLNLGVLSFFFAFLIGYVICGMSINKILGFWPYKVLFTLMSIPMFFGYAAQNGTVGIISDHLIYRFRKASWASPIALFLVALVISTLGAGNYATVTFIGPVAFTICAAAEINPLISLGILLAATMGGGMYWAGGAATTQALLENAGVATDAAYHVSIAAGFNQLPMGVVLIALIYVFFKGWKAKSIDVREPAKMNSKQKTTFILILVVVGIALLSMILSTYVNAPFAKWMGTHLDVRVLCLAGAVICAVLKLGNESTMVKSLPWNTMFMVTGVGLLMGIAQANGLSDILGKWISTNIPNWLIPTALLIVSGLMSFFSSALSVVYPVLMPIAASLCAANPNFQINELMTAILVGGALTGVSPFSTGGSLLLATCDDEKTRDALVPKQFLFTFVLLGAAALLTLVGMLKIVK
ncbi:MAG: hypothetical protein MJ150_04225 [Clostridia bacterium]|nr:hypothetical protein [Clostridia bacterium]